MRAGRSSEQASVGERSAMRSDGAPSRCLD